MHRIPLLLVFLIERHSFLCYNYFFTQSRMCVNTVIAGDYEKPMKIAAFLSELDAAFRLLNLKNDALRKKFDGLKYDLKKVEEVVYDLSIRGLKKPNQQVSGDG